MTKNVQTFAQPIEVGELSSDPTTQATSNGLLYYNTTSHVFKGYVSGAWKKLLDVSSTISPSAGHLLFYTTEWTSLAATAIANDSSFGITLANLKDVSDSISTTSGNLVYRNGASWDSISLVSFANDATFGFPNFTVSTSSATVSSMTLQNTSTSQSTGGILRWSGATSGTLTHQVPNTITSYVLKWPDAQGGSGTVITNDGSGNLSWSTPVAPFDQVYTASPGASAAHGQPEIPEIVLMVETGTANEWAPVSAEGKVSADATNIYFLGGFPTPAAQPNRVWVIARRVR